MFLRATDGSLWMLVMSPSTEIASYRTYTEAQAAIDSLLDKGFDVKSTTAIGIDLHLVERVTGQLIVAKAALLGVPSGVLWGAFMGLMMSFASANQSTFLWAFFGIVGGASAGTSMSGFLYAMMGECRDFISQS